LPDADVTTLQEADVARAKAIKERAEANAAKE
jgi:hypothetical protein